MWGQRVEGQATRKHSRRSPLRPTGSNAGSYLAGIARRIDCSAAEIDPYESISYRRATFTVHCVVAPPVSALRVRIQDARYVGAHQRVPVLAERPLFAHANTRHQLFLQPTLLFTQT
jgi:hypothetical protein